LSGILGGQHYWAQTGNRVIRQWCRYCDRVSYLLKVGTEVDGSPAWWLWDGVPLTVLDELWLGVMDFTGTLNTIISKHVWRADETGNGSIAGLDICGGGIRVTTAATTGNDEAIANGDNAGVVNPWCMTRFPKFHVHFRIPEAGDLTNTSIIVGLYQDADNWFGLRFDTSIHGTNMYFVTRAGGAETVTSLGAADNEWREMLCGVRQQDGYVRFVLDGGTVITHTTNIPTGNFTAYMFIETLEDAAKKIDFQHVRVLQDHETT